MDKEEILERNKKSNISEEDEMEQYINGKAGISAKFAFTIVILILVTFKNYKHMQTWDIWSVFTAYGATESFYKYYYLRHKKLLVFGVLFSIGCICSLFQFLFLNY